MNLTIQRDKALLTQEEFRKSREALEDKRHRDIQALSAREAEQKARAAQANIMVKQLEVNFTCKGSENVLHVSFKQFGPTLVEGVVGCCRFQRHRVRCMNETGGEPWSDASLRVSSSWRR
jgi:hypothetical protein